MKFGANEHLATAQQLRRKMHALAPDDPEREQLRAQAGTFLVLARLEFKRSPSGANGLISDTLLQAWKRGP